MKDPQTVSNLRKFMDNYDWSGLEFSVSIKDIGKFENRNNISVNVLAVEGRYIYIHRKGRRMGRGINLLMVSEDGIGNYTVIKSLSRLLSRKNSNTKLNSILDELLAGFYTRVKQRPTSSLLRGQLIC